MAKMTAEQAMKKIYDLIFLDEDSKGTFLNPEKECRSCADFFDGVYDIATCWKPLPRKPDNRPVED